MIISLLFLLLPGEPQQPDQQMLRQQQQLEQVHRQLQDQQRQLDRVLNLLETQDRDPRDPPKPFVICSVELRRENGSDNRKVPPNVAAVVPLNLFSTVSNPDSGCLPAEVRVTASYLDNADNLVCSGTVEGVAFQTALTQSINIEVRPWNFREFVRWKNEPPQVNSGAKRLVCVNPEGTAEITSQEFERVFIARVRATILPVGGGMSTAEIQLNLR